MWACIFYLILCFYVLQVPSQNQSQQVKSNNDNKRKLPRPRHIGAKGKRKLKTGTDGENSSCWLTLNAKEHFETMEALEKPFEQVRREYDEAQYYDKYDEEILGTLLSDHGGTHRETQKHGNQRRLIPSGLNLGGFSMLRMADSLMFFHRMKLRNDTVFRVNYLSSNFTNMVLTGRLALNDLHLIGSYERVQTTPTAPSTLFYTPSYGEVEFLLRNVVYKMEGRYRLQRDRLFLEMILSELYVPYDGILMMYRKGNSSKEKEMKSLQPKHISDFLNRMKTDLDLWLKDFFNEFLLNHPPITVPSQEAFQKYDKERIITLNRYVDEVIGQVTDRLEELDDESVKLPNFSIYAFFGFILDMTDGTLTGLETMYRRSMATNKVEKDVREVDALVSFSSLKVRYSYEVKMTTGAPPLYGSLILTADELTAIMRLHLVKDPPFVDMKMDFLQQIKPESLTVEGSVAGVIANFKHLLELHIVAIMTNTMIDQVKGLKSLVECVPTLFPRLPVAEAEETEKNDDKNRLQNEEKDDVDTTSKIAVKQNTVAIKLKPHKST
ncbi:uncharacterized protein LOC128674959 [Plodia interpunctella]|uniref:uncharacterized protein LOC128674959 n=1 Tax=Plodia interpunctella TaxID=58824 RepID=UPI00236741E0|nr:uncharacterized protein LOC128674959 [Plodia interpunctella]